MSAGLAERGFGQTYLHSMRDRLAEGSLVDQDTVMTLERERKAQAKDLKMDCNEILMLECRMFRSQIAAFMGDMWRLILS